MPVDVVIHRLNTGWLETRPEGTMLGAGRHPDLPDGHLHWHGLRGDIQRLDGTVGTGTIIPVTAWYIETDGARLLVDTGNLPVEETIALHQRYGGTLGIDIGPEHSIAALLDTHGVAPGDIDFVIQTHLHYDHIGATALFRNATFLVHEAELAWALAPPPYASHYYYYPECRHHVQAILDRVQVVHGDYHVVPGVTMLFTGGHSPGHCAVSVEAPVGRIIITGDLVYTYKSLEHDWPSGTVMNVRETLDAIQFVKSADVILITHDSMVEKLFPTGSIGREPLLEETVRYMERVRSSPRHRVPRETVSDNL